MPEHAWFEHPHPWELADAVKESLDALMKYRQNASAASQRLPTASEHVAALERVAALAPEDKIRVAALASEAKARAAALISCESDYQKIGSSNIMCMPIIKHAGPMKHASP